MFERIFTPALAFMLLAGGTFAVGHELFAPAPAHTASARTAVVAMPTVAITGRRAASMPLKVAAADPAATRHHVQ